MKRIILLSLFLEIMWFNEKAMAQNQSIDALFFGQNYWYAVPNLNSDFSSTVWSKVVASGCKILRYGGTDANQVNPMTTTASDYRTKVVSVINGHSSMATIVQLPFDNFATSITTQANFAKSVVADLKANGYAGLMYSIANEPDLAIASGGWGYSSSSTSDMDKIINYVKTYVDKIKEADETAIIIAPDLTFFDATAYSYLFTNNTSSYGNLKDVILSNANSFAIGKNYVDIVSFHMYPSATISTCDPTNCTGDRSAIIDYPSGSFAAKCSTLTTYIGTRPIAVTEYNTTICTGCSSWNSNPVPETDSRSFIAGQMIADLMSVGMSRGNVKCMNMWSVEEATPDRGYLINGSDKERSSYWHYKMLATNFKDTYIPNSYNGSPANQSYFKAFAYKNTTAGAHEVGVVIMNQDQQSPPRGTDATTNSLTINFGNSNPSSGDIRVRLNTSTSIPEYPCTITKETTMLLVFDSNSPYSLLRKEVYNLGDALRTVDTGAEKWGLTSSSPIVLQSDYDSYFNAIYSTLVISPSSSITAVDGKIIRASNQITVNGPFSSGGQTLQLTIKQDCQ